jgi:hypothetical protein
MIWKTPSSLGKRVTVIAKSLEEARLKLEKEFGEGTVFNLHNEICVAEMNQSASGRCRPVVILRDFFTSARCYARPNGRVRPGADVQDNGRLPIRESVVRR